LREALETQAARLCLENAGETGKQDLVKMAFCLDQLYASGVGADEEFLYSLHTYHMRFHLRIAELGGNSLLLRAVQREQVLVFNWLFDTAAQRSTLPPLFHSNLASKLSGSDVAAADQAMRAHVRYGIDQILAAMHSAKHDNGWRVRRKADFGAGSL
jgi:DNA-binding GntR family transcriptional regulator